MNKPKRLLVSVFQRSALLLLRGEMEISFRFEFRTEVTGYSSVLEEGKTEQEIWTFLHSIFLPWKT